MRTIALAVLLASVTFAEARLKEKQETIMDRWGEPDFKSEDILVFRTEEVVITFKFKDNECWQVIYRKPSLGPISNDQIEAALKRNGYGQDWKRVQIGDLVTFEREDGKAAAVVEEKTIGLVITSKEQKSEDQEEPEDD